jgi:hypothetical protein
MALTPVLAATGCPHSRFIRAVLATRMHPARAVACAFCSETFIAAGMGFGGRRTATAGTAMSAITSMARMIGLAHPRPACIRVFVTVTFRRSLPTFIAYPRTRTT